MKFSGWKKDFLRLQKVVTNSLSLINANSVTDKYGEGQGRSIMDKMGCYLNFAMSLVTANLSDCT